MTIKNQVNRNKNETSTEGNKANKNSIGKCKESPC